MIAYIDTSVLLRVLLNQKNALKEFKGISHAVSSRLLKTETLRTLDRLKSSQGLTEKDYIFALEAAYETFKRIEIIPVTEEILERASLPIGMVLGTLDAIHLFSAALWRERVNKKLVLFTHDMTLARAAKLLGMDILGAE